MNRTMSDFYVFLLLLYCVNEVFCFDEIYEEVNMDTTELLRKHGYPVETHHVTTEDGYILELHRVPHGKKTPPTAERPAVLLVHGLLMSSAAWVLAGPHNSLAYILADLGYDVWLGNNRGNTYSRAHAWLNPNEMAFWNFSFHELGVHDAPAMIDYVLTASDQEQLLYVGHSQGCAQFFVMASLKPEYNSKIRAMFALAPAVYMTNIRNPVFRFLASLSKKTNATYIESLLGISELFPTSPLLRLIGYFACHKSSPVQTFCSILVFVINGFAWPQQNKTLLPIVMSHFPEGASTKQVYHYTQLVNAGRFQQYDYEVGNMRHYGTASPPLYDVTKITCPVSLHYSANDWLVEVWNVEKLYSKLLNPIGKFLVPFEKFNHFDFLYAIDVKQLLYNKMTSLMAEY